MISTMSISAGARRAARRGARGGSLLIEDGHRDVELGAPADFTLHPDAAALRLDEVPGDGKSQPRPASLARASHVHPIEALENTRLVGPRDADTRVRHGQNDFAASRFGANKDFSTRQGILHCIVKQVLKHLGETPPVRRDLRQVRRYLRSDFDLFLARAKPRGFEAALHPRFDRDW